MSEAFYSSEFITIFMKIYMTNYFCKVIESWHKLFFKINKINKAGLYLSELILNVFFLGCF